MAAGYATARPPVHSHILARIRARLPREFPLDVALDVGCGAGLSTAPLLPLARRVVGLDLSSAMVGLARRIAPGASFFLATLEALPVRSESVDIMTAAGSLNWADLDLFFADASRVLKRDGTLVVYDFSPGRRFADSNLLDRWFAEFEQRYPWPPAQEITPEKLSLAPVRLRLDAYENFEISLSLDPAAYLDYVMTETNVVTALDGVTGAEIRAWCARTLEPVFSGVPHDVLFRGYIAYIIHD